MCNFSLIRSHIYLIMHEIYIVKGCVQFKITRTFSQRIWKGRLKQKFKNMVVKGLEEQLSD